MKTLNIRYIKSGSINIDIPKEIIAKGEEEILSYCENKMKYISDEILADGLKDLDDSVFDETPEIEQIADVENDYKELYSTTVWDMYSDPEYAKNILAENKNMANYLSKLGLTQEYLSNICYGSVKNRGSIDVTFISLWDGDTEIETPAKLNVDTGEVHSIVTQDVESYDLSILSLESIRINDIDDDFDVIRDYENMEFAIDPDSLNKINELIKEHKALWANEGIWHEVIVEGKKFSFQLNTGACDEPIQPFNGDVLIDNGECQFTIDVTLKEDKLEDIKALVIDAIKTKYFTKEEKSSNGLALKLFNGLSIYHKDLSVETRRLLLNGYADFTPNDVGGLIFKKETLTSFLEDDFFDNENKPSSKCLEEIKNIVSSMSNTESSILYLC
jgi:hypothetical protein